MPPRVVFTLYGLILLLFTSACLAARPIGITPSELALAPPYCPDTQGFGYGDKFTNTSPRAKHWVGLMGETFWAMHHYCWAMLAMNRADRHGTPPSERKKLLTSARGDLEYVLENIKPNFTLLPEVLLKKGVVLVKMDKDSEAALVFRQAAQVKQDYWPAYAGLADLLLNKGQVQDARAVIEEGLKYAPDSKLLNSMLAELTNTGARKEQKKQKVSQQREPPPKRDQPQQQNAPKAD